jgi:hypothetical protein
MPEMIFVPEMISVFEAPSSVFCKAMATKTTPAKPSEMAAAEITTTTPAEMAATAEMTAATPAEMAATATEPSTSSAMATAASTVTKCGGGRNRQNTGQNQTGKETVK